MDWIATLSVIDPYHYEPPARRSPADHLICQSIGDVDLDSIGIARLFNFRNRNVPFGMIGAEVLSIGIIPDDWPIVHPFSICKVDGQIGVARGI